MDQHRAGSSLFPHHGWGLREEQSPGCGRTSPLWWGRAARGHLRVGETDTSAGRELGGSGREKGAEALCWQVPGVGRAGPGRTGQDGTGWDEVKLGQCCLERPHVSAQAREPRTLVPEQRWRLLGVSPRERWTSPPAPGFTPGNDQRAKDTNTAGWVSGGSAAAEEEAALPTRTAGAGLALPHPSRGSRLPFRDDRSCCRCRFPSPSPSPSPSRRLAPPRQLHPAFPPGCRDRRRARASRVPRARGAAGSQVSGPQVTSPERARTSTLCLHGVRSKKPSRTKAALSPAPRPPPEPI